MFVLWDIDGTLLKSAGFGWGLLSAAFLRLHGRPPSGRVAMAGRTDRAIAADLLACHGISGDGHVDTLHRLACELAEAMRDTVAEDITRRGGGVLPGAGPAVAALADAGVVQSVLSGNLARVGAVKLGAFREFDPLDLSLAAFGDDHLVRADLVTVARLKYADRFGAPPAETVLVGDTPLDIEAARLSGARVVAVATGHFGVSELADAGAPVVLADLRDTSAVLTAIRAA